MLLTKVTVYNHNMIFVLHDFFVSKFVLQKALLNE